MVKGSCWKWFIIWLVMQPNAFSYTSLAKTIGIKHTETVKNYLEYLENTYLLFQVMKFDWSVKKQMNNQKKVYFIDNAIIGKVGFNATDNIGQLLENLVFLEIKRQGKMFIIMMTE